MTAALEILLYKIDTKIALSGHLTEESLRSLLAHLNIPEDKALSLKVIGEGSQAVVLWLPDKKRILKITRDHQDADVAAKLVGKKLKHLLHVQEVLQIEGKHRPLYAIIAEKLTPLSSTDRKAWNNGLKALAKLYSPDDGKSMWLFLKRKGLIPAWIELVKESLEESFEPKVNQAVEEVLPAFESIADDLDSIGVTNYWDVHSQNVMMRGRTIVLVDFGTAQVSGSPSIQKL